MPPGLDSRRFGNSKERRAAGFLQQQGLRLVASNFYCPMGELDLVMQDREHTLVFIEVRYRSHASFGSPEESVTLAKQKKMRRAAAAFLQRHRQWQSCPCRFDVVGIRPAGDGRNETISWLQQAFF